MTALHPGRFEIRFEQNFPADTDDDPDHEKETSRDGDAAEPTDVKPDMSEKPPESSNLSAAARELMRKTHVNLGHSSKASFFWFPKLF